jgi:hypothetical protein
LYFLDVLDEAPDPLAVLNKRAPRQPVTILTVQHSSF